MYILERQTLDVWVNGNKVETEHSFVEEGTEIKFEVGEDAALIKAAAADKKHGIIHQLYINDKLIEEDVEL